MSKTFWLLIAICFFSFVLRIYCLDKIPNSLSGDEVSFGYNAYSILKTGRDEYGVRFPLLLKSFNDHKNPVFVYLLVPFVWKLGLNEFAIRLPSVIAGIFIVLLFYLLTKKLTGNTKLALLTALLSAVSPWLIQYSRVALEVNLALLFCLATVWLFFEAVKKPYLYLVCSITAGLAFWTYYASKLWILLFFFFLVVQQILKIKKISRFLALSVIMGIIFILPYLWLYRQEDILARQYGISVFSQEEQKIHDSRIITDDLAMGDYSGKYFHNRRLTTFNQLADGYLGILSPRILFSQSSENQNPQTRLLYLWQIPLIIIGLFYLARHKSLQVIIILWLAFGFLPGALTMLPTFDRRVLVNSYPLILLTAFGIWQLRRYAKLFAIPIIFSFIMFSHEYYNHASRTVTHTWGNGMKELVNQTLQLQAAYKNVIVSTTFDRPLTYFLFYTGYSPSLYLKEGGTQGGDFREQNNRFSNYSFKEINPSNLSEDTLYVWGAGENQPCLEALATVSQSDGIPLAKLGPVIKGCEQKL